MADLELHGAPGPGAQRRHRERAAGPGADLRPAQLAPDGDGVGRQRDHPVARLRRRGRGRPAVGRVGLPDAQGQGRRRARDRGPRRARPRDPRRRSAPTSASGSTSTARGTSRPRRTGSRRSPASTSNTSSSRSPADDIDGLAELRRRVRVPIAADEAAESVRAVRALLAADAVDVLVIKPARVGGPAAVAEIAELAAERGVPVVISTLFETGVGIAAALAAAAALPDGRRPTDGPAPPDHGLATAGLLDHDLLAESLVVADGRMHAPARPGSGGLGIVLDVRALERFRVEAVGSASDDRRFAVLRRLGAAGCGGATRPATRRRGRADALDAGATSTRAPTRWPAASSARASARAIASPCWRAPSAAAIAALHGIARVGAVAAPLGVGLTAAELAAAVEVDRPRLVVARRRARDGRGRARPADARARRPRRARARPGGRADRREPGPARAGRRRPDLRDHRAPEGAAPLDRGARRPAPRRGSRRCRRRRAGCWRSVSGTSPGSGSPGGPP